MPSAPAQICGYCHRPKNGQCQCVKRPSDQGNKRWKLYSGRWRKVAAAHLAANPLCVECAKEGIVTPATEVDHIIPHRGDQTLFWATDNRQSLCASHHSKKTKAGF